ncbi:MAG: hypothetical protein K8S98_06035 [Planctomycetes bacterium]|nr:hypothetical protein [Planctomycetota bacterium]
MTHPHDAEGRTTPAIDEAEDLFSFDELLDVQAQIGDDASIAAGTGRAPAFANLDEDAMSAVLGPDPTKAAPTPAATNTPSETKRATPAPAAPAPAPAAPAAAAAVAPSAPTRNRKHRKGSPMLIGALAVFALANLALIGLTWKSMSTLQESLGSQPGASGVHDGGATATNANSAAPVVTHERIPSQLDVRPEGEETLDAAHEAIERGDFAGARRMLWGLLAVADRWAPSRRDDLEARATFTIADSYRLEADTRAGSEAQHAPAERELGEVHAAESEAPATGGHR